MRYKQRQLLVRKLDNIMQDIKELESSDTLQAEKLIFCAARIIQKGDRQSYDEKKAGE